VTAGATLAQLACQPINLALTRAHRAACEHGTCFIRPPFEFACLLEGYVRRGHFYSFACFALLIFFFARFIDYLDSTGCGQYG
jgi:hypothetical protein